MMKMNGTCKEVAIQTTIYDDANEMFADLVKIYCDKEVCAPTDVAGMITYIASRIEDGDVIIQSNDDDEKVIFIEKFD